jgi:hypothetical protein
MALAASKSVPLPAPADELVVPANSSGHVLMLDQVESVTLRQVADRWTSLRGTRRFPARADLSPKNLKNLLRHIMLLKVIDGGADYEFRIVGDVQVLAYGQNYSGMRLSELGHKHPKFAEGLKIFYDAVRTGRAPFGYRGWIGRDMPDTRYSHHEIAFFPLGPEDDVVDHILIAGVYVMRGLKAPEPD